MSEIKLPRLLAAAKEFNIGQDTLVEFLAGKGFNRDDLKPAAKLSEGMYEALQREFQGDKVAKAKSDMIDLPKGERSEPRRRREDEEINFTRKDEKKHPEKEIINQIQEVPKVVPEEPIIVETIAPPPPPPPLPPPPPPIIAEPEVRAEPIVPIELPTPPPVIPAKPVQEPVEIEIVRLEAPELEGPKIIDKIDLSIIDSSTRPKKFVPKPEPKEQTKPVEARQEPVVAPIVSQPREEFQQVVPIALPVVESPSTEDLPSEEAGPVIENIQAERLSGPKILGKIELPVDSDTRPKPGISDREKRKRKRIPLDKRQGSSPGGGQNRPPQQGGGVGHPQARTGLGAGTATTPPRREGGMARPIPAGQPGHHANTGGGGNRTSAGTG